MQYLHVKIINHCLGKKFYTTFTIHVLITNYLIIKFMKQQDNKTTRQQDNKQKVSNTVYCCC